MSCARAMHFSNRFVSNEILLLTLSGFRQWLRRKHRREKQERQLPSSDYEPSLARTRSLLIQRVRAPAPLLQLPATSAHAVKHLWQERCLSLDILTGIVVLLVSVSTKWHWKSSCTVSFLVITGHDLYTITREVQDL